MKKAVIASLLAVASVAPVARFAVAQTQVNLGTNAQQAGGIQLAPAEYNDYNNAVTQTTPQAQAAALEAFLTKYPQSQVKGDVLQRLTAAYSSIAPPTADSIGKTIDAADRLLQVDPNNPRGLLIEAYFRTLQADSITDAAQKQAALDKAAEFGQKGLSAPKPQGMSDADFNNLKGSAYPIFHRAIAADALGKKDAATAVTQLKQSLGSVPEDQTKVPGPLLQDTYTLATAYYQTTPPDLVNCAWYASRAATLAPEPYKSQMMPLGKYCYRKYHGNDEGFDAVVSASQASLNPPAGFSIKPAPSPADIVKQVIASTPDLSTLAISDKEFILQNGSPDDSAKVWDTVKGKSVQIPDATVIAVSDTALQVAVSDDAVQSKTADFTFQLAAPLKTPPAVGDKVTISGTYASFTPNPIMITMSDGALVEPKKAPVKKPTPAHRPAHK
jgi:hypothetical protein